MTTKKAAYRARVIADKNLRAYTGGGSAAQIAEMLFVASYYRYSLTRRPTRRSPITGLLVSDAIAVAMCKAAARESIASARAMRIERQGAQLVHYLRDLNGRPSRWMVQS